MNQDKNTSLSLSLLRAMINFLIKIPKQVLIFAGFLVLLNLVLVGLLFSGGWNQFVGSFEYGLLSKARFIQESFPLTTWNFRFETGFPWMNFDLPLASYLLAILKGIFGWASYGAISRFVGGFFYIIGPALLYLFTRELTKKELAALVAAVVYILPAGIFSIFQAIGELIGEFTLAPYNLIALVKLGDLPHIIGLSLLPLAGIVFLRTIRRPTYCRVIFSILFLSLFALLSLTVFFAALIILFILAISELLLGKGWDVFWVYILILLLGAFLAGFWLTPSFWGAIRGFLFFETPLFSDIINLLPLLFVVLPILAVILFLIFDRKPEFQGYFIGILWIGIFGFAVISYYLLGKLYLPFASEFLPELIMGLSILAGVLISSVVSFVILKLALRFREDRHEYIFLSRTVIISAILIVLAIAILGYNDSKRLTRGIKNIESTPEFKIAKYLKEDVGNTSIRVFASPRGAIANTINLWSDVPQVRGPLIIGKVNPWLKSGTEEILNSDDEDLTKEWLRVFNSEFVVVDQSFASPQKFDKIGQIVFKENNYQIYKIDSFGETKLAGIVEDEKFSTLKTPGSSLDFTSLGDYNDLFINLPEAEVLLTSNRSFKITADLKKGEGVATKLTYHPGWKLYDSRGNKLNIKADPLGYIYIPPQREGRISFSLNHGFLPNQYFGFFLTSITIFGFVLWRTSRVKNFVFNLSQIYKARSDLLKRRVQTNVMDMMLGQKIKPEEFRQRVKDYYRKEEDISWVERSEGLKGIDSIFIRNRERLMVELIKRFGRGNRYLDVGCGDGLILRHLPPGSVGIDINPRAVAQARKNAPQAAVVEGDVEKMPFDDKSFTTATCTSVIEHLVEPEKAVREISRVLESKGVLIGTVANISPLWRLRALEIKVPEREPFRREFRKEEVTDLLLPEFNIYKIMPALSYMVWVFIVRKKL